MALLAFLLSMLAGQGKACLAEVVEAAAVQTNERESRAFMLRMTAPAIRFANCALVRTRMKPCVRFHSAPDLRVTFQTLENTRARSENVTRQALGHGVEILVSS